MLLTTHSMEEAEALGDSIGVLVRGQLRALGPGLALKRAFSSRYEVRVLTGGEEGREGRGAQVAELLRREMPCAKVEVARGVVTAAVPREGEEGMGRALRRLEGGRTAMGVRDVQLRLAPLESAFFKIVHLAEAQAAQVRSRGGNAVCIPA